MFGLFGKKSKKDNEENENIYDPEKVTVFYEGQLISPEYATETLVFTNNGETIRDDFNTQGYSFHNLFPHGKGKITYKDGDKVLEEYEGEFLEGQYHGHGTLTDIHGEILEGEFKENKFIG